jgi:glucose/arabinose dehydrogenase
MRHPSILLALSPLVVMAASCAAAPPAEKAARTVKDFTETEIAKFDEPWAMAFIPGTPYALITERKGKLKYWEDGGEVRDVAGVPAVAYQGQGGLGDVALAPDFADSGTIYLSWAEAGDGDTRGAAVGRAKLVTDQGAPRLEGLQVIWRQTPKVTGAGHYSHRLLFSPDGRYLFVSSGERQKFTPAQDMDKNLGKIVRLNLDGTPAAGNPFQGVNDGHGGNLAKQFWSYGHRNVLGLKFDAQGRLWDLEHGPKGGDELNLVKPGQNYGWPLVSDGDNYDGTPIPRNATRPDLAQPAISWNPVIAPGDFIFYSGSQFPGWNGQAIIGGMKPNVLVRVAIEGEKAREVARYPMAHRIREVEEREDGSIWLLEDGKESGAGRLLKLMPKGR